MTTRNEPATPCIMEPHEQAKAMGVTKIQFAGLSKLEALAMQIYTREVSDPGYDGSNSSMVSTADWAIKSANIFFDQLEKGNE